MVQLDGGRFTFRLKRDFYRRHQPQYNVETLDRFRCTGHCPQADVPAVGALIDNAAAAAQLRGQAIVP